MNGRRLLRGALILAVLIGLGWGAYSLFTRTFREVTRERVVGYAGPARTNRYYLLQVFLQEASFSAQTLQRPPGEPPGTGILFWLTDAPLEDWWRDWVAEGNHLVVLHDPFAQDEEEGEEGSVDMLLAGHPPVGRQYGYGEGCVTVVPLALTLSNPLFDDPQRALHLLTALRTTPGLNHVWLFVAPSMPWFGSLLVEHAWPVLLSLAVCVLMWLWRQSVRFGPLVLEPPRARRSMLEHHAAVGQLAARTRSVAVLCRGSRTELLQRLAPRVPGVNHLQGEALVTKVAEVSGVDAASVRLALTEPLTHDPERWVQVARALQTLWRIR